MTVGDSTLKNNNFFLNIPFNCSFELFIGWILGIDSGDIAPGFSRVCDLNFRRATAISAVSLIEPLDVTFPLLVCPKGKLFTFKLVGWVIEEMVSGELLGFDGVLRGEPLKIAIYNIIFKIIYVI